MDKEVKAKLFLLKLTFRHLSRLTVISMLFTLWLVLSYGKEKMDWIVGGITASVVGAVVCLYLLYLIWQLGLKEEREK